MNCNSISAALPAEPFQAAGGGAAAVSLSSRPPAARASSAASRDLPEPGGPVIATYGRAFWRCSRSCRIVHPIAGWTCPSDLGGRFEDESPPGHPWMGTSRSPPRIIPAVEQQVQMIVCLPAARPASPQVALRFEAGGSCRRRSSSRHRGVEKRPRPAGPPTGGSAPGSAASAPRCRQPRGPLSSRVHLLADPAASGNGIVGWSERAQGRAAWRSGRSTGARPPRRQAMRNRLPEKRKYGGGHPGHDDCRRLSLPSVAAPRGTPGWVRSHHDSESLSESGRTCQARLSRRAPSARASCEAVASAGRRARGRPARGGSRPRRRLGEGRPWAGAELHPMAGLPALRAHVAGDS